VRASEWARLSPCARLKRSSLSRSSSSCPPRVRRANGFPSLVQELFLPLADDRHPHSSSLDMGILSHFATDHKPPEPAASSTPQQVPADKPQQPPPPPQQQQPPPEYPQPHPTSSYANPNRPAAPTYAALHLARSDRVRLVGFPPSVIQPVHDAIWGAWALGIQKESTFDPVSYEFKLKGNPCASSPPRSLGLRSLLQRRADAPSHLVFLRQGTGRANKPSLRAVSSATSSPACRPKAGTSPRPSTSRAKATTRTRSCSARARRSAAKSSPSASTRATRRASSTRRATRSRTPSSQRPRCVVSSSSSSSSSPVGCARSDSLLP